MPKDKKFAYWSETYLSVKQMREVRDRLLNSEIYVGH